MDLFVWSHVLGGGEALPCSDDGVGPPVFGSTAGGLPGCRRDFPWFSFWLSWTLAASTPEVAGGLMHLASVLLRRLYQTLYP